VIPAEAGRLWRELISPNRSRRDHGRAFLHCAIYIGWNPQAMPMDDFLRSTAIRYIDDDLFTLRPSDKRPGHATVVRNGTNDFAGRNLEIQWSNFQPYICRRVSQYRILRSQG
jgi:hypothetical protein